jgi:hypothetical protein
MNIDDGMAAFLASHGGPFFELQRRLRLLHEEALHVGRRATIFIVAAWGVPLLLTLGQASALGDVGATSYLADPTPWARFFVAIGCFLLAEQQVEERLRVKLSQFRQTAIIAPASLAGAAEAVSAALRRRNSGIAEAVCLAIAIGGSFASLIRLPEVDASTWAVVAGSEGGSLTPAGWWCIFVSLPMFWFLLLRGLWRHHVWSQLLRRLASLEFRLVVSHPDGKGGLAFVADYPNAYAIFVFGVSCAVAAALAHNVGHGNLSATTFSSIAGAWLAIVLALFAFPLLSFSKPLAALKEQAIVHWTAAATRYHRLAEKKALGHNLAADDDDETEELGEAEDPARQYASARGLSIFVMNRASLVPVALAALFPLAIAAATKLPSSQIVPVLRKLLLL